MPTTFSGTDRCGHAIVQLERILAPVGGRPANPGRWRKRVRAGLRDLRDAFTGNRSGDPYAELCQDSPRLWCARRKLDDEYRSLVASLDVLVARARDAEPAALRRWTQELLGDIRRHRGRIADLLHQAYTVDIGGET